VNIQILDEDESCHNRKEKGRQKYKREIREFESSVQKKEMASIRDAVGFPRGLVKSCI
jgi:hypothetical protein